MKDGRIRILMVTTCMGGGVGWHIYQLARHLDPERFDIRLAFARGFPIDHRIEQEGIPHRVMRWRRSLDPVAIVQGTQDLVRLLRSEPVDILHAHCSVAGVIGRVTAAWCRVPHVLFSVHALASRDYQPAWRKQSYLAIERSMDRFTERYFVFTEGLKSQIVARRITRPEKIEVVPHGVEIPECPGPEARARARDRLGLRDGELGVVAAGRLETQKGIAYLIQAFRSVVEEVPEARLILLGDGPLRARLEREAQRCGVSGAVRFLGWRDDVAELLPGADLFCMPSLWEALPYALIEAMVYQLPIVASAVDSMPDVLGHGAYGALAPPGDPGALARTIAELLCDPCRRQALAAAARRSAVGTYALSGMIARYEAAYAAIVGRGGTVCAPATPAREAEVLEVAGRK